jgi:hypothetical protein
MLRLPEGFEGSVYVDSADVVDVQQGVGYSFTFETWIDSSGNKRCIAKCSGDCKHVQAPQELPVIVKHEFRVTKRGELQQREAAFRRAIGGAVSLPCDAVEIIHAAYSLDGLAADIFTKAFPHLLQAHRSQLPAIAAAAARCARRRWFSRALAARDVLARFVLSAVVRTIKLRVVAGTALVWGTLQRACLRAQYSSLIAASALIGAYLRKKIVFWEVSRRWRATDVVVRKFRQKKRWLAWRRFVACTEQLRVLMQRLLPFTHLRRLKQALYFIQR